MKKKHLFATHPLYNLAPHHSEVVMVRLINTSSHAPVTFVLLVTTHTGSNKATTSTELTVAPSQSELKGFTVGEAEEYQVQIESDAPHVLLYIFGVDNQRRVVGKHRVLHSQMSSVR